MADAPTPSKHRRWRWLIVLVVLAVLGTGAFVAHRQNRESNAPQWRTAVVSRGSIVASVSATGTLNAEVSVPVGSQVSGQIKEVLADFNAEVKRGQLIARIDPETFEYRVRQSQADVDAARAQVLTAQANISAATAAVSRVNVNLAEARRDLDRKQQLVARNFISGAELDKARAVLDAVTEELSSARAQVEVAQAQAGSARAVVAQREASLLAARADLERTAIRAPVDGIVIKRSIDAGQTVAASLQAPELFVIARDLRDMQVDTSIDEAEIGKIKLGQRATFTVDSYPGRSFSGTVKQVRKAALTVQNVVTYTVVVSTPNPDLALIPGMTANVRVVTDTRENVLKVPNAALRFRPPDWQEPAPGAPAGTTNPPAPARSSALPGSFLLAWIAPAQAQGDSRSPPGAGGPLGQFRERLERDLALSADQKTKLDAIFSAQRETFRAAREAGEAERPALMDKARAELRDRIAQTLSDEQKRRYQDILAEMVQGSGAAAGAAIASAPSSTPAAGSTLAAPGTAPASPAATPPATPTTGAAPTAPGGPGGPGGAMRQFRERIERELSLSNDQRTQLDAIFAGMREKFAALREAPEAERPKLAERNRAELRDRIADILNSDQKKKYAEIVAEIAGRQSIRGRVFILDAGAGPRAAPVRTGLTDGAFTEISGEGIQEGTTVIIGLQTSNSGAPKATAPAGPRLPF